MTSAPDLALAVWRKSSHSDGGDNNCVEVADGFPGTVPVRDSKCPSACPLVFAAAPWGRFVEQLAAEQPTAQRPSDRLAADRKVVRDTIGVDISDEEFELAPDVLANIYKIAAEKVRATREAASASS
ncbi:DUF397 domain-containing protein [Streptomyces sp. YIM S03343]